MPASIKARDANASSRAGAIRSIAVEAMAIAAVVSGSLEGQRARSISVRAFIRYLRTEAATRRVSR